MRRVLKYWLPVLLWMIFIFGGSTDFMSSEHTSRFLVPFLRWLVPSISDPALANIQLVVRKCAHVAEYAILAVLMVRAFRQSHGRFIPAAVRAFVLTAIYAILDEFHQSFVLSRSASPYDVALDILGALAGLTIYLFITRQRTQHLPIANRKSKM